MPRKRVLAVVQRAAVRRVDADGVLRRHQPDEAAALGAVAVVDIGVQSREMARHRAEGPDVARADLARHRESRNAKLHLRRDGRKRRVGAGAAGRAVADDADLVAARRLAAGDIEDVPENAADRGPRHMHDLQALRIGHRQNQRSPTSMVSPGRSGARSGSAVRAGRPCSLRVMVTVGRNARGVKPPAMAMAFSTVMLGT